MDSLIHTGIHKEGDPPRTQEEVFSLGWIFQFYNCFLHLGRELWINCGCDRDNVSPDTGMQRGIQGFAAGGGWGRAKVGRDRLEFSQLLECGDPASFLGHQVSSTEYLSTELCVRRPGDRVGTSTIPHSDAHRLLGNKTSKCGTTREPHTAVCN